LAEFSDKTPISITDVLDVFVQCLAHSGECPTAVSKSWHISPQKAALSQLNYL